MNNTWEYSQAKYSDTEIKLGHLAEKSLGKLYPKIGANVAININLYVFILKHLKKPDTELAKMIRKNNKQVFSVAEIAAIKKKLETHSKYINFNQILGIQTGGSAAVDETRNGFWDKMIRKITAPLSAKMTPMGNYILWWIHILYHLEQQDLYGPFISQSLDVVTLSLPVLAEIAEDMTGKVFSLAPVPYASFLGDAVGYLISLMFVLTAVLINNSRKHFGSAFVVALDAVPLFGEMLSMAANNFEKGANRFEINKKKMVGSVSKISPSAGQIIYSYVPDSNIHTEPLPPIDTGKITQEIEQYAQKKSGLSDLQSKLNSKMGDLTSGVTGKIGAVTAGVTDKVGSVTTGVTDKVGSVTTGVTDKLNLGKKVGTMVGGYIKKRTRKNRMKHKKSAYTL
jgi:hypothetical protein